MLEKLIETILPTIISVLELMVGRIVSINFSSMAVSFLSQVYPTSHLNF